MKRMSEELAGDYFKKMKLNNDEFYEHQILLENKPENQNLSEIPYNKKNE